jgi:16S rRNA (adenine1518-N6/adenine1519-N6)-dimethyltransferase
MELFRQHGFNPRTDLGQNFLIDLNLVEYIVDQAQLGPDDVVLEVGSGTAGMTAMMAPRAGAVVSVEDDTRMFALAQEVVAPLDNVTLLNCDALRHKNQLSPQVLDVVRERLERDPRRRLKLVSNLPYNIATPIVSNLVATELPWVRMVVTIQWELAQRMTAKPGQGHYGALSVWLGSQCRTKVLKRLRPAVFWPRPQVDSAILRLAPDTDARGAIHNRRFFHDFLRRLFHQRRKFLRGVLAGMYRKQLQKPEIDAVLQEISLPEGIRAEQLEIPTLVALSNQIRAAIDERASLAVATDNGGNH